MTETLTYRPDLLTPKEADILLDTLSKRVVTLAFAIEVKVIRENTLEGVPELFTDLDTLRQEIEECSVQYPQIKKKLANIQVMIDLLTTGVQIGDKRRGLLEVELGETKRAL